MASIRASSRLRRRNPSTPLTCLLKICNSSPCLFQNTNPFQATNNNNNNTI